MPNFFQLFKKDDPKQEPAILATIDEKLCNLLGFQVHETKYVCGWFDSIGWRIAVFGMELGSKELRDSIVKLATEHNLPELITILDYLEANYTSTAWASIGNQR